MQDNAPQWFARLPYYESAPFLPPAAYDAPSSSDFDEFEHDDELEPLMLNERLKLFAALYPASAFFTIDHSADGLDDIEGYEGAGALLRDIVARLDDCLRRTREAFKLTFEGKEHYGFRLPDVLGYDVDANGKRVEAPAVPSDSQTESLIWLTREELAASAPSIPVSTVGGGRKEKREAVDNALVAMREAVADESAPSAFSSRQWPDESDAARRDYERAWRGVLKEAPGTQEKLQAAFNILAYMWGRLHGLRFLCYQLIQSGRGREMRLPAGYLDALARVAREAERDATDTALAFNFTASLAYERRGRGRKSEFDVSPEEAREAKRAVKEEFARSNMKHSSEDVLAAAMAKLEADGKKTPKRTVFIELLAKK